MTVHGILAGQALCGMRGLPVQWPDDHVWTYIEDLENINCSTCKDRAISVKKQWDQRKNKEENRDVAI